MKIGYACMTIGVPNTQQKTCRLKNADEQTLLSLIGHNLNALKNILLYNIQNDIRLFRISSEVIPFGSHPINTLPWQDMFSDELNALGRIINDNGLRVSMHPGQYTVLNSPNADVVKNAVIDLNYHTAFLDSLGVGSEHKLILHIGGIYNDKVQAVERFISCYRDLNINVKKRLVIENDEKCFSVNDVLSITAQINIPVIYDHLHHLIYSGSLYQNDHIQIIRECGKTWKENDGMQKIHYSQQEAGKKDGTHARTILIEEFMEFYGTIKNEPLDIMLEVKDKNLSAMKCINCITAAEIIEKLEEEWVKYQQIVFENSPVDYYFICQLLKKKEPGYTVNFYKTIEHALQGVDCTKI